MTRSVALAVAGSSLAASAVLVAASPRSTSVRYPLRYEQSVTGHARSFDLEPNLVAAVIYQESKFDADAVSSSVRSG